MLRTLKVVHESGARIDRIFYPKAEILGYEKKFREANFSFFADYAAIRDQLLCIAKYLETVDFSPVLCHIDFIEENVLVLKDGKIRLIDWEYAAMSDPMMDLAIFIISSGYDPEDLKKLAELYFDRSLSVKEEKSYMPTRRCADFTGAYGRSTRKARAISFKSLMRLKFMAMSGFILTN